MIISKIALVNYVSTTPSVQRHNTLRNRWPVPRMADNYTPMNSGTPSWSCQILALFDMLPRAPITIGLTVTFEAPWIPLISIATWYFSTFSSSVLMMFWSAGTAMSIRVHFRESLCTRVISARLCFTTLSKVTLTSPFSTTLPHITYTSPSVSARPPCRGASYSHSSASFLHPLTMCHTVSMNSPHNLHSVVCEVLSTLCHYYYYCYYYYFYCYYHHHHYHH